jgi:hypothetical protein
MTLTPGTVSAPKDIVGQIGAHSQDSKTEH